jgi:hypothetical protein
LLQEFRSHYKVSWDNYTVSNADAKELGMSNEIANGNNGSYATITTKDYLKLENVPVIVQPVKLCTVGLAFVMVVRP